VKEPFDPPEPGSQNLETPLVNTPALKPRAPWWQRFFREVILETLLPAWLVITFLIIPVGVRGDSMDPTLDTGNYLLVLKLERWLAAWGLRPNYLKRGDIVVVKPPADNPISHEPISKYFEALPIISNFANALPDSWTFRPYFVKRIIGMPGDTVEIKSGQVFINDQKLFELYTTQTKAIDFLDKTVVQPGTIFVMGDNRKRGASLDSRAFGLVKFQDVSGRAVVRIWPLNRLGAP
jgi:signal peptidase I